MRRIDNGQLNSELLKRIEPGLSALAAAKHCAEVTGRPLWDLAISIHDFYRLGMIESDVRSMTCAGLAQHAREVSDPGNKRLFEPAGELKFDERSCFTFAGNVELTVLEKPVELAVVPIRRENVPYWDQAERKLWLCGKLVKAFKHPATNQEIVLLAFERAGWPHWINDPLPPISAAEAKRRLHDTIRSLNRNLAAPLIHFNGNGTGRTIAWELVAPKDHPRRKKNR